MSNKVQVSLHLIPRLRGNYVRTSLQITTSSVEPQKSEMPVKEPRQSTEVILSSAFEEKPGLRGLHVVRRHGKFLGSGDFRNETTGFDASHMGAWAMLSVEEEKNYLAAEIGISYQYLLLCIW